MPDDAPPPDPRILDALRQMAANGTLAGALAQVVPGGVGALAEREPVPTPIRVPEILHESQPGTGSGSRAGTGSGSRAGIALVHRTDLSSHTPSGGVPLSTLTARFEIVSAIGGDAFGELMLGRERDTGREVIIRMLAKTLPPRQALDEGGSRLLGFDHPHVARVLDTGEHLGQRYVVTVSVHGRTLADLMPTRCPMPELDVLRLAEQVAEGLGAVHQHAGLAHGDVRPATILVEYAGLAGTDVAESESARITDLLCARIPWHNSELVPLMAQPTYVPPEAFTRPVEDLRADLWSLAAMMFHLLVGEPPYPGPREAVLAAHQAGQVPDLSRLGTGISDQTRTLLLTALSPRPSDRFLTHQGFIVACQKSARALAGGQIRSMRFLRKPMGPTRSSSMRTPLPTGDEDPFAAEVDVSTRILAKHRHLRESGQMPAGDEATEPAERVARRSQTGATRRNSERIVRDTRALVQRAKAVNAPPPGAMPAPLPVAQVTGLNAWLAVGVLLVIVVLLVLKR